jgi:ribosome maturation factor RimP
MHVAAPAHDKRTIEERAIALLSPLIAAEGFELVEVEYVREQPGWILRLYVDKPGGGISLDECAVVSRAIDPALDVEDLVPHEYSLEVSSPGLNRPLRKPEHFVKVKGQRVKVKTFGPIGEPPRKNFTGTLADVGEQGIRVDVEGAGPFDIPFRDIAKANLEFQL